MPSRRFVPAGGTVRRHSLNHAGGTLFYINTLNIGFAADVATLTIAT